VDLRKEVVARVGDRVITLEEFNKRLPRDQKNPEAVISPAQKKAYLEQWVQRSLFYQEAKRLKFEEQPDVAARIEAAIAQVLVMEYVRMNLSEVVKVEEAEVRAYWEKHPEEFTAPRQVRARHLLVKAAGNPSDDQKALQRAEQILARVRGGDDFAKLAGELSEDTATKEKGGDLGFFVKGRMAPEFEAAAFAAKPGEVVGPVKTTFGYHLIKVEEIREPMLRPFEMMQRFLHDRLLRERQHARLTELMNELKGRIPVEMNLGLFDLEQ
jgi:parvulin-like peptidyl-prolyl isomerase